MTAAITPLASRRPSLRRSGGLSERGLAVAVQALDRQPLHIRWDIGPATLHRNNVIDDVAQTSLRIAGLNHELFLG